MRHTRGKPGAIARFLWKASYTTEGVKGVLKDGGTGRRTAVEKVVAGLGRKIASIYFALGEQDVYAIAELPGIPRACLHGWSIAPGTEG